MVVPTNMASGLLYYGSGLVALHLLYRSIRFVLDRYTSPLQNIHGPAFTWELEGQFKNFRNTELFSKDKISWLAKYGKTLVAQGIFYNPYFFTTDLKAISFILTNTNAFHKPDELIYLLSRIVGPGVLVAEGSQHKLQRKIMNPAFGPTHIRDINEIFLEKTWKLASILTNKIKENNGSAKLDVLSWFNRLTLDIIGTAGFGYEFDSLSDSEPSELNRALATLFTAGTSEFSQMQAFIPILRYIPTKDRRLIDGAQESMNKIALRLLKEAKAAALEKDEGKAGSARRRDLLSLLVRANLAAEGNKLSDEDVIAQVPTFFVAGHETTSTAVTWTLFALACHPEVQSKLRAELSSCPEDYPSVENLNALPYLEKVIREVLRLYSPVPHTDRVAAEDTVVPLETPIVDRKGVQRNEIRLRKGDHLMIPINAINLSKDIWGEDVDEFKPDRWDNPPAKLSQAPGVYANMLTFLGGPRACIGYRFALTEMKTIIFVLIRSFNFEMVYPREDVGSVTAIVHHPEIKGQKGHQLPLRISPASL